MILYTKPLLRSTAVECFVVHSSSAVLRKDEHFARAQACLCASGWGSTHHTQIWLNKRERGKESLGFVWFAWTREKERNASTPDIPPGASKDYPGVYNMPAGTVFVDTPRTLPAAVRGFGVVFQSHTTATGSLLLFPVAALRRGIDIGGMDAGEKL